MTPQQKALTECVKALQLAICLNWHDMLMTGEELRRCEAAITQAKQALDQFVDANKMVQAQADNHAKTYARNLCLHMQNKFYPDVAQFEPQEDLLGMLTQIDNMVEGLVHPQASEPVGINGLTQAETDASMSVRGLSNPTASEPAWRPIETAPKDGGILLGVWEGDWNNPKHRFRVYEATMYKTGPSWAMQGNYRTEEGGAYKIAGWVPLPAAPEAK